MRPCIYDDCKDATWRESSAIRSSNPAVLSGVEDAMLALVGRGLTSEILSTSWEAKSRVPSVWPASVVCTCGGSRLLQMMRRKSCGTSGLGT